MPLLIHELTHVWQYQRGEGWGSLPGMIWEAVVGNYEYGGEDGLKEARAKGQAFSEFTTEQQGDILQHYYVRLKARLDVSAYEPWVNDVKPDVRTPTTTRRSNRCRPPRSTSGSSTANTATGKKRS